MVRPGLRPVRLRCRVEVTACARAVGCSCGAIAEFMHMKTVLDIRLQAGGLHLNLHPGPLCVNWTVPLAVLP